jgi:hypothetical protein
MESSDFYKRLNEYNIEIPGRMYIFEVTKFCGYSTFVYMYKDETMTDLYNRISYHFCCKNIKGLYINNNSHKNMSDIQKNELNSNNQTNNCNHNCCCFDKKDTFTTIPISSLKTVKEFVFENTATEPRNLVPVYPLPLPVVYRIYLDDGHCHIC